MLFPHSIFKCFSRNSILSGYIAYRLNRVSIPVSTLLNESGGTMQTEESSAGGGANYDLAVVSYVVAKINLPLTTPKNLSTGLVTIGRTPFINCIDNVSDTYPGAEKTTS